jgi:hypothetical protein
MICAAAKVRNEFVSRQEKDIVCMRDGTLPLYLLPEPQDSASHERPT